jgi:hypothetical protein
MPVRLAVISSDRSVIDQKVMSSNDSARRAALARELRQRTATGQRRTFQVQVQEGQGWWRITVPELPWIQTGAHKRSDIGPAARNAIASALQVPPYFFDLHFHIED